ncbi:MmgE/PrpD family protein [Pseudonocardia kujensis]|uniref:MmgE/PrpD family protein n=1 Tax=Pseudonocardia kujensis TaxID=1128675 RepID=UPI001E32D3DC|nr:MmgE/PrpD family protein [Pseudonocardia kujensis]MCE0763701.1 MmgE/PrpD family protein [Pseudonocardia kujensis]
MTTLTPTSSATDPTGPTGTLATWLAATTLDDVPGHVRDRAAHLLLDAVACALVGARLPVSERAVEAITALEGPGAGMLIGWNGRTTSAAAAAMLNSSFVQGFELDDYHPFAPLHSGSLVLPAMLAAAPPADITGDRFLLGAVLGFETGPRVGLALHGSEMLTRGWHSGPVFGTHAAAVAAGAVLGLDAVGYEDALGIAATQSGGLMSAQFESMVKRMQHGFAARNGLIAAALAAGGYVGIKRVFEREYGGYLAVFGEGHEPDPTQIGDELGRRWETERIAVKAYAAMGGLHAGIDAARALRADLDPERVERIEISCGEAAYHHGGWRAERPLETIGAQMNLAYAVAVALLDGDALLAQFTEARIASDDVWRLIDRTETRHDPGIDELGPTEKLTTRVRLTLTGGQSREHTVRHPRGTGNRPLSNEDVVAKYRTLTAPLIGTARRHALEAAVLGLAEQSDLTELASLLTPAVRPALG